MCTGHETNCKGCHEDDNNSNNIDNDTLCFQSKNLECALGPSSYPQILNGRNVADYIDPNIELKLVQLEKEEEQLAKEAKAAHMEDCESDLDKEEEGGVTAIRERKAIIKKEAHIKNTQNHFMQGRKI